MALGNLNTADFIKGSGVSQDGRIITIETPVNPNLSGFNGQAFAVWSGSGLIFNVYAPSYYIAGVLYPSVTGSVTLDTADVTNARFDVIGVDATGEIKITGTPAASPVIPTIDNLTQLAITTVYVDANATTPTLISDEDVYKENVEWTGSSDTTSPDFANTSDPLAGSNHVNINGFTANQYVKFTDASTHDLSDYNYLKFYVKLKGTFAATAGFILSFRNGATIVSSEFTVTNGVYGFDRTDLSGYQLIVIPLNEFTISSTTFDTVYFKLKGSNTNGFKLDNVVLQGGITGSSSLQNAVTTIQTPSGVAVSDQANDTFNFAEGSGMTITASGKTITFASSGGGGLSSGTTSGTDTYTVTITGVASYTAGDAYVIKFANANTGASTLNINSIGAVALKKSVSTALASGDLAAGSEHLLVYDGTNFQVLTISGGGGSGTINSGSQYRIPYYSTNPSGTTLDAAAAITASRALKSDANGVPTHFDTTTEPSLTELSYVKGLTSAIQTQIDANKYWRALPTMTRTDGDTFTIPDVSNAGNWQYKLDRLRVIKWTDTTTHVAIVKSSSYSSDVVTVEIAGDTLDSSFTNTSGYYTTIPAKWVQFAQAGTITTATNIGRKWYADRAYRVLLAKANHGTAGTTNATTYDLNKNGSTMFTTKLSVSSADTTGDDTSADNNTSLASEDYVTLDCDSVSTTRPIDAYIDLYLFPTNDVYL